MRLLLSVFLLAIFYSSFSQNSLISSKEQELLILSDSLSLKIPDSKKNEISLKYQLQLIDILKDTASYNYPFRLLTHTGFIYSSDKKFRMITWNFENKNGTFSYFAVLQIQPHKNDSLCEVMPFSSKNQSWSGMERQKISTQHWPGCLYYDVVKKRFQKKDVYVLLGFAPFDQFINTKVIETLSFDANNKPILGVPVINVNGKLQERIIFQFSARVGMLLQYEKEKDVFIFDHLSPSSRLKEGLYQEYGPDASFDALIPNKEALTLVADFNPAAKNKK
jgi:hypothetical protein